MIPDIAITVFALAGCLAYAVAAARQWRAYQLAGDQGEVPAFTHLPLLGIVGVVCHLGFTIGDIDQQRGISSSFFDALSITALIVVLTAFVTQLRRPIESLMIPVFIIASLCLALAAINPGHSPVQASSRGIVVHIFSSIIGYSLLSLATVQAIALQLLERGLKHHHTGGPLRFLPPLQTMESLLFQLIGLGWTALGVAIASGILFIDDFFAQHLAHKTVFSILSWIMFGILLWGRHYKGWRASTAVRWTLVAFAFLVLGYFGSKFVLEIILQR